MEPRLFVLLSLLALLWGSTSSHRVLMVTLCGTKSHKIPFLELGHALIRRGHSVTLISAFPPDEAPLPASLKTQPSHPQPPTQQSRKILLSPASQSSLLYANSTEDGISSSRSSRGPQSSARWGSTPKAGFFRPPSPTSPTEDASLPGIVEITPHNLVQYAREFTDWDLLGRRMNGLDLSFLSDPAMYAYEACRVFLSDPATKRVIRDRSLSFDLLVADGAFPECILGFAHRFRVPFMYINTVGFHVAPMAHAGSPTPYAVTPFFMLPFIEEMTFQQRLLNSLFHFIVTFMKPAVSNLLLQKMVREAFGPDVPNIEEHGKNVSFVLQNGHASVSYARPFLPLVAEVACIHCKTAKPLPAELEDFVSGGPEGFIFFSMGSSVKATNMPPELKKLFADAFARLSPIRVLWKWENSDRSGLPDNVMVSRWLPQQDLLGHPKIRAFVTHGGLLSMFETVFHGVPIVTMPVFCDHDSNSAKAVADGYAIKLEVKELTVEALVNAVRRIMFEPEFRENVRHRSLLLRDQPESPLDRAVYWTEYVIRHDGAKHLQSPLRNLNILQAHNLDVAAFFLCIIGALLSLLTVVIRYYLPRIPVTMRLFGKTRLNKHGSTAVQSTSLRKQKVH